MQAHFCGLGPSDAAERTTWALLERVNSANELVATLVRVNTSESPLISHGDEILKRDYVNLVRVIKMLFQPASCIEVAGLAAFATKNEVCLEILVADVEDRRNQADYLEGDFLLGSPQHLFSCE